MSSSPHCHLLGGDLNGSRSWLGQSPLPLGPFHQTRLDSFCVLTPRQSFGRAASASVISHPLCLLFSYGPIQSAFFPFSQWVPRWKMLLAAGLQPIYLIVACGNASSCHQVPCIAGNSCQDGIFCICFLHRLLFPATNSSFRCPQRRAWLAQITWFWFYPLWSVSAKL